MPGFSSRGTLLLTACWLLETARQLAGSELSEPQGQPVQRVLWQRVFSRLSSQRVFSRLSSQRVFSLLSWLRLSSLVLF